MLRITTLNAYTSTVGNLQTRQSELNDAQNRLTSGKRVLVASDDPTAAARAERARALTQRAVASQRAVDASKNSMTLTESALGDAVDLVQQARELLVSAGNASYSDAERKDVANQIAAIRKQLMSVANRGDGAGGYVFSGQGSSVPPFMDRPGGASYVGTGGAVQVASEEPLPLTLDGEQVWLSAPSGNGVFKASSQSQTSWADAGRVTSPQDVTGAAYTLQFSVNAGVTSYSVVRDDGSTVVSGAPYKSGQAIEFEGLALTVNGAPADGDTFSTEPSKPDLSVFDALDQAVAALQTPQRTPSQITQSVQDGLRDLDQISSHLQGNRSMTGEVLNRIDGVEGRLADTKLFGETTRSNAEDLDMVQAISDFKNQETGYSAALQTYSTMQKMSLFDYIKT
jgi:flagellar hook-associated protein 3 FlgL